VHIRDNLELDASTYRVTLKGAEIGRAEAWPGRWLAIDPGQVSGELEGTPTQDPAFGLPAIWIDASQRERAQVYGYTVVDASTVVATHLNHLLHRHASEMLGRQEVQKLLDKLGSEQKSLVEEVVPKALSLTAFTRVLQQLLDEDVSIRDLRTILDTLAEHATHQQDPTELTALVRIALGRAITEQWFAGQASLNVIGLEPQLEQVLNQAMNGNGALEPGLAQTLMDQTEAALARHEATGAPPVLVVSPNMRPVLARFLRRRLRHLVVMSQAEIPDDRLLRVTHQVGGM
ncbi:MAG: FHIPEP family type III secretion protein, partial [Pseudomonadota bacterium]|nr:FHIPEP family type III secretion protein [Pseudomonadota bacterium]